MAVTSIHTSWIAATLTSVAAIGLFAWGARGIYEAIAAPYVGPFAIGLYVLALLAAAALPFLFRLQVGTKATLHRGRIELRAPFAPVQLLGAGRILGWGHLYRTITDHRTKQVRHEVSGILLFTKSGTIELGGWGTEGELEMRGALAERFVFCDLEGFEGTTAYPVGSAKGESINSDLGETVRRWACRLAGVGLVVVGCCLLFLPGWQRWYGPAPVNPPIQVVRGILSTHPRVIFGGPTRPNALVLRLDTPDSLAFVLSTSQLGRADRTLVRRMKLGDTVEIRAYADELSGSTDFRYVDWKHRGRRPLSDFPIPREYGRRAVPPLRISLTDGLVFEGVPRDPFERELGLDLIAFLGLFGFVAVGNGVRVFGSGGPLANTSMRKRSWRRD